MTPPKSGRQFCKKCASELGKQLWEGSCACTGDVTLPFKLPGEYPFAADDTQPPITAAQVAALIKCLVRDDQQKKLEITFTSHIMGKPPQEIVQFIASGYSFQAFVNNSTSVANVFFAKTPKGANYHIDLVQGKSVASFLSIEEQQKLTELVLPKQPDKVELRKCYVLYCNGVRSYPLQAYETEADGQKALEKLLSQLRSNEEAGNENGGSGVGFKTNDPSDFNDKKKRKS